MEKIAGTLRVLSRMFLLEGEVYVEGSVPLHLLGLDITFYQVKAQSFTTFAIFVHEG